MSLYMITPMFGFNVVNGYEATAGFARDNARSKVDLPAFGKPTLNKMVSI